MKKFKRYLIEMMNEPEVLKLAIKKAKNFTNVSKELKAVNMKYNYSTSPIQIYVLTIDGKKTAIVKKKYADKPDYVVGDIAVGSM